jgi:hypothetical protein
MSKKIMLFCALAFVVAFAASAYAEVQNVKVSGDINVLGIYRDEYDLDDRAASTDVNDDSSFYSSITRVKVEADLTDNVQATVQFINEKPWNAEAEDSYGTNDADIALSYITLKEFLYSPLTLTLGTQGLRFGNALVVGDPDTNAQVSAGGFNGSIAEDLSARKGFDAIRATLDYSPWTVDLIAAKICETDTTGANSEGNNEDEDLYGINAAYKFASYNAATELYLFIKDSDSDVTIQTIDGTPSDIVATQGGDIYTWGLRGALEPIKGLGLTGEIALQKGDAVNAQNTTVTNRDQDAWALDLDGTFAFDNEYVPTLGVGYSYRSGQDITKSDGDYKAWNPMYEDQTNGVVADYLFSGVNGGVNSNASIIKVYGSVKPTKDITLAAKYYNYKLVEKLVTSDNSKVCYPTIGSMSSRAYYMKASKDLGDEVDLMATYDYTDDVQFGLTAGWFMPGKALKGEYSSYKNSDTATSIVGSVKVTF